LDMMIFLFANGLPEGNVSLPDRFRYGHRR
jgi:hypothetical protein